MSVLHITARSASPAPRGPSGGGYKRKSCAASPTLNAALHHLLEIRVRRVLSAEQSKTFLVKHPSEVWSVLEIRSIMPNVDPFRLHLLKDAKGSSLYARLPADPQVFTVDADELALLSLHCSSS